MNQIFIKIYGAFHPVPLSVDEALTTLRKQVIGDEEYFFRTNDMINISYEGIWFPLEDALKALGETLPVSATGKLDVLDLEDWTLTRHVWENGEFVSSRPRDLNTILDYSGH